MIPRAPRPPSARTTVRRGELRPQSVGGIDAVAREAARRAPEELEQPPDLVAHVLAVHDAIDEPLLQHELRALESGRQVLADGLADDPRPGEADQPARL